MKILILTQHFYPENFRFNDFALGFKELGHEVTVLTGIPNYPQGTFYNGYSWFRPLTEYWNGIKIIRAPLIPRRKSKIFLALNYISFPITSTILSFMRCRDKYDAVIVCQSSPIFMALAANFRRILKREPTFLWITDLWPESLRATKTISNPTILKIVEKIVCFVYRNVDCILISCKGFKASIESKGIKTPIKYFPYWAEDIYKPVITNRKIVENKFVVTFGGNIGVAQGLSILAEVAAKLKHIKNIVFVIIGEGRGETEFKNAIKNLGVESRFNFMGSFPSIQMPELFSASDVLFLSLRKDPVFEITVPSKLQSYLACGKPIIASIDGEGADILNESGAGFVTPAGDAESLAQSLEKMYHLSPEHRKELGLKGYNFFEKNFKRLDLLNFVISLFKDKNV